MGGSEVTPAQRGISSRAYGPVTTETVTVLV